MKRNFVFYYLSISFIFLELAFKLFSGLSIFSIDTLFLLCFILIVSSIFAIGISYLKTRGKIITIFVILALVSIYSCIQICIYSMYNFYFQFSSLSLFDQVAGFSNDILLVVSNNLTSIIVFLLPTICFIYFKRFVYDEIINYKQIIIVIIASLFVYLPFMLDDYGYVNKVFSSDNMIQIVNKLGVGSGLSYDSIKTVFPNLIKTNNIEDEINNQDDDVTEYDCNCFDINFEQLNSMTDNSSIIELNNYFMNKKASSKNEYTGFFKNKNLILFMAESFNGICVNKELTPTLYKLINSGFSFSNFYTPTIYSTIGGEYTELTSLFPDLGESPSSLYIFRSGKNSFPMGLANIFKNEGYGAYAYHNSSYSFQDRNLYLKSLGFDNYNACGIGLENKIDCTKWPSSDVSMIEATFDDYINEDKFVTFYATVSGHGRYDFSGSSAIAPKYEKQVREYYGNTLGNDSAAEHLMAYVANQMELDRALETLINKLEAVGKLDDTVIALVGDHHPYYLTDALTMDEYNRLSTYKRDRYIELYHSNFIIYNSMMQTVHIDKVGSQLDVIPTLYNLFGLDFDSRLLIGNDLLSSASSIAIMNDNSWIDDYGRYYASTGEFVSNNGLSFSESYVNAINKDISNKFKISRMIMRNNYYQFVYENKPAN